jgi:hypothetical protein
MLARNRKFVFLARPQWREYGKARAEAHARSIQGFPLRWELVGNQDWKLAFCRFSSRYLTGIRAGRRGERNTP